MPQRSEIETNLTKEHAIDPTIFVMHRTALTPLLDAFLELYEWVDDEHATTDTEHCDACNLAWPCPVENARLLLLEIADPARDRAHAADEVEPPTQKQLEFYAMSGEG